jgi:hypothetical protein
MGWEGRAERGDEMEPRRRGGREGWRVGGDVLGGGEVRQIFGPEIVPVFFICEISGIGGIGGLKNVFHFERERRAYLHLPFL